MTDPDLSAIRVRYEHAGQPLPDRCSRHVLQLVAEVERLTRLLGEPFPSSDSYESMAAALADERASVVQHCDRIEVLETLLAEVLRYFPHGAAGIGCRSDEVLGETLERWRSRLERAS